MASQKKNVPHLIVFTDLDEEFDDKLAVYFISKFGIDVTIVFMPSSQGSSQDGFDECKRMMPNWNNLPKMKYILFEDFTKLESVTCDYVLQISPMGKMENGEFYSGHNLIVTSQYIFGGIYRTKQGNVPSFNLKGSDEILGKFENILVDISSELMAEKRPFMELYNVLPPLFKENMRWTSFKLALGRMSENHPVAHIYAEGLINPLCGRGANFNSVKTFYNSTFEYEIENYIVPEFNKIKLDKDQHKKTYLLTKQYLDKIKAKHPMTENHLFRMNIALSIMFPGIWNNQEQLISSDKVNMKDTEIQKLWKRFNTYNIEKVIKTFNPVYDLFASYILLNVISIKFQGKITVENDPGNFFENDIVELIKNGSSGMTLI